MKILALIPARGGSKGIPRKNLAQLGGKPLIAWTIEAARRATGIARVVVSTDSAEIAEVATAWGAEVPFLRPSDISGDTTPALPVICHAMGWLEENASWTADAVAYLQPTSPFRNATDIDIAITLLTKREADTVVSVVSVPHNMVPTSQMEERDGWLSFRVPSSELQFRRQSKDRFFARNGPAILLNRRATILGGALYGKRIAAYEMSKLSSLDIDDPEDLAIAEALLPLLGSTPVGASSNKV